MVAVLSAGISRLPVYRTRSWLPNKLASQCAVYSNASQLFSFGRNQRYGFFFQVDVKPVLEYLYRLRVQPRRKVQRRGKDRFLFEQNFITVIYQNVFTQLVVTLRFHKSARTSMISYNSTRSRGSLAPLADFKRCWTLSIDRKMALIWCLQSCLLRCSVSRLLWRCRPLNLLDVSSSRETEQQDGLQLRSKRLKDLQNLTSAL